MGNMTQKIILAAAAFLIVFGGLIAGIYTKYNQREQTLQVVDQLKGEIKGYDEKIATREAKKKLKAEIEDVFTELVDILPQASPRQKDNILDAITQYAAIARIKPKRVVQDASTIQQGGAAGQPQPGGPPKPQFGDAFEQTALTVNFEGTFANFMKFLNMVENHRSFLRVDDISLTPVRQDVEPRVLDILVKFTTFHYVVK